MKTEGVWIIGRIGRLLPMVLVVATASCQPNRSSSSMSPPPGQTAKTDPPQPAKPSGPAQPAKPDYAPPSPTFPLPDHDAGRWLTVDKVRGDAPGAWATGSFDRKSNKLIIDTHDVDGFSIDTTRAVVDWNRRVILRLDGHNSQLKRRDNSILRFVHDDQRGWYVEE